MYEDLAAVKAAVPKGVWRHFKGNLYEVVDIAQHSETREYLVVYRALYGERGLWVRPVSMWLEEVERDGARFQRFTYAAAEEETAKKI